MAKEKKLILVLCLLSIGSASGLALYSHNVNAEQIRVVNYRAPEEINENGYQIDKCDGIKAITWLNENEVLTTTKKSKDEFFKKYLSIYNVNTKESKEFKDIDMKWFYGISKTGKYILYAEEREVPADTKSEEWKAYDEGTIQREPIKLLNLESGEITNLKTQNKNVDARYGWISDDKILMICNNESDMWQILNINGEVCSEGKFNFSNCKDSEVFLTGAQNIKDLGNTVEGKFYYTKSSKDGERVLFSMDISTKEEQLIDEINGNYAEKRGDLFLMNYYNYGDRVNGISENRTYGFKVFDEEGNIIQTNESPLGMYPENYRLSSDGSKVCYLETKQDSSRSLNEVIDSTVLKVMDVKSGHTKEVVKLIDLIESEIGKDEWVTISNLSWDASGTSLLFSLEYSKRKRTILKLSESEKRSYGRSEDTIETSVVEKIKNDSYIVTFDK